MQSTLHNLGGIDEAGLGPLLGPLVVGGVVLKGPAGEDPWTLFQASTCKKPKKGGSKRRGYDRRIRVNDSKVVHSGAKGKAELERTALTFLACTLGKVPQTVQELLEKSLDFETLELSRYPWYQGLDGVTLPRWADDKEIAYHGFRLRKDLENNGASLIHSGFRVVPVGVFNKLIHRTNNKNLSLYFATESVLLAALHAAGKSQASKSLIVLDRHGGRSHYGRLLQGSFPKAKIQILDEAPSQSRYSLGEGFDLLFAEKGDQLSFPTAAASCIAKYIREIMVERINVYFITQKPDLKPTAGYYQDGRRFLKDASSLTKEIPRELLVRIR
jgi:ribonuclease HII